MTALDAALYLAMKMMAATAADTAAEAADKAKADDLAPVVVVGTRTPRALIEQTATVSVIDAETLKRQQANDVRDALRYEPGVSVTDQGSRFGLAGVTIRGIGGNRVNLQVDGVRASQAYSIGDFSNASRDFFGLETISQIEILRGAASSLYGSDALGGVVRFNTLDPSDLLSGRDAPMTLDSFVGYSGIDDSLRRGSTFAGQAGDLGVLVSLSRRDGQSRETQGETGGVGSGRTQRDPTDYRNVNFLGKLVYGDVDSVETRLTLENVTSHSDTRVLSQVGRQDMSAGFGFPYFIDTGFLNADDERERRRASLAQTIALPGTWLADRISWQLDAQYSDTDQRTAQSRTVIQRGVAAATRLRDRRFLMEEETKGGQVQLEKAIGEHRLTFGIELLDSEISGMRDGRETNTATGVVSTVVGPDAFPVRDFPNSDVREWGFFVQDEWQLSDTLKLVPGVRYDRYELDPRPDAIFIADNPGVVPVSIDEDSLTPKLGASWDFAPNWQLVGQVAEGFRSPPFNDVNIGFTNFQFGYTALPNPDLKPERSRGGELGIRFTGEQASFALTAFHNRYRDFIESLAAVGEDPQTGLILFQSRNVDRVRIQGAEFKGSLQLDGYAPWLENVSLTGSVAYADGEDRNTGESLSSIDPLRGVLGILWQQPRYALELASRFSARNDDIEQTATGAAAFEAPGYLVLDLYAHIELFDDTRLDVGIGNLFDRTWYEAANVRGRSATDPALLRYSEPGRTFSVTLRQQF